ncbi:dicarboxylate/amino acid:cation symporter [Thermicanus aegyptius]|uniref:dicarboxylate/amino acid:cation symporter n=1 Tax=Thermicanus aegyptius TaxID=94009 RepID=UPI00048E3A54|nr:dicarboxylate/amino acid:cation symporter [Thermicanus aegyptius]
MKNNLIEALVTNWVSIVVTIAMIALLYILAKQHVKFGTRVLISLGLGILAGIFFHQFDFAVDSVKTVGQIFVNLIKMIVMPLVFTAIITSIMTISNPNQLRKIGVKTIGLFLLTTGLAAIIGIIVSLLFHPGTGVNLSLPADFKQREIPSFWQVILDLTPVNPVNDLAQGKVVPAIIFALFLAVAMVQVGAKKPEVVEPVRRFFESFLQIMYQVTKYIIRLTPYGVYALVASMAASYGAETLMPLISLIAATYVALFLHFVIVFGGMVSLWGRVNPIKFFRKIYPMMVVAFTTRSSFATLPINLEVMVKRLRISERIASFVAPLGTTMNYNGCGGVWPAVVAVFVAEAYGVPLGITDYVVLVLVAMISSVGVAGVPGPASISTTVVLTALGLPLEGLGLVLAIDALVDMGRTLVNRTGDPVIALIIARQEKEFDQEAFDRDEEDELETSIA